MVSDWSDAIRRILGSAKSVFNVGWDGMFPSFVTTGKNMGGACRADRTTPESVRKVKEGRSEQNDTTRRSLRGQSPCGSRFVKLNVRMCGSETERIDGLSRPAEAIESVLRRGMRESNGLMLTLLPPARSTLSDAVCAKYDAGTLAKNEARTAGELSLILCIPISIPTTMLVDIHTP